VSQIPFPFPFGCSLCLCVSVTDLMAALRWPQMLAGPWRTSWNARWLPPLVPL
jgi:hypothetical protein